MTAQYVIFLRPRSLPGPDYAGFVPAFSVTVITFVFPANPGSFFNDLQGVARGWERAGRPPGQSLKPKDAIALLKKCARAWLVFGTDRNDAR